MTKSVIEKIEALLPQTHCEKCTYAGCEPYAKAVANKEAPINLCQPGGEKTMQALASLLDVAPLALDPIAVNAQTNQTVKIDEATCIGCTKCIKVCPVDAIVGAAKKLHNVIDDYCTGCELCLPVCPVDCIEIIPDKSVPSWIIDAPSKRIEKAKQSQRLNKRRQQRLDGVVQRKKNQEKKLIETVDYKADIQASILRAKAKRNQMRMETTSPHE